MKALAILFTILFITYTTRIEYTKPIDNTPSYMLLKRNKPTFSKKKSKEIIKTLNKYKEQNNG